MREREYTIYSVCVRGAAIDVIRDNPTVVNTANDQGLTVAADVPPTTERIPFSIHFTDL